VYGFNKKKEAASRIKLLDVLIKNLQNNKRRLKGALEVQKRVLRQKEKNIVVINPQDLRVVEEIAAAKKVHNKDPVERAPNRPKKRLIKPVPIRAQLQIKLAQEITILRPDLPAHLRCRRRVGE